MYLNIKRITLARKGLRIARKRSTAPVTETELFVLFATTYFTSFTRHDIDLKLRLLNRGLNRNHLDMVFTKLISYNYITSISGKYYIRTTAGTIALNTIEDSMIDARTDR